MGWNENETSDVSEKFKPKTALAKEEEYDTTKVTENFEEIEFDFEKEEDTEEKKEIWSFYGHKNSGKTSSSFGIPYSGDKVLVLSFDNKSKRPTETDYVKAGNLDIRVFNAIKYLDKSSEKKYLESSVKTHAFILSLLEQSQEKFNPDWVMFDGTEVMSSIMEIVMRSKNNLKPYQGIANRSLWRERRQYVDDIHMKAVEIANKGIIYTMYSAKDSIIEEGNTVKTVDVPKWIGSVMEETDMVVHTEVKFENSKNKYIARVEGSKIPDKYPDGEYIVTGKRLRDVLEKTTKKSSS